MLKKMFSHYTCCKLRDLGGHDNLSKKWCQKSSKMVPKSSFGHPGLWILRFGEDLIEVWFLMIFGAAQKSKQIWKKEAEVWKQNPRRKGRRQRRGPRRAFGVYKIGKICQSLQKRFKRPVPCEQGAADWMATATCCRPPKMTKKTIYI